MAFVTMTAPAVGDPTRQDWAQLVSDNLNFLYGTSGNAAGLAQLVNGSFEEGTGANTAPTGWALSIASGNSTDFTTSTADVAHGRQGFKMVTPGSITGGVILTSDFMLCATGVPFVLGWLLKCSAAGTKAVVAVKWYDEAESIISTDTLYTEAAANPTSWTYMMGSCTPPASARLFKVVLTGVDNTTAASVYWDGVGVWQSKGLSSVLFTADGTYTPSPGVTKIKARMWGAGGGGGAGSGNNGATGADSWVKSSSYNARGGLGGSGGGTGGFPRVPVIASNLYQFGGRRGSDAVGTTGGFGARCSGVLSHEETSGGGAGVAGNNAPNNSGAGGGGGGGGASGGGGGAAGEYAEAFISLDAGAAVSVQCKVGGAGGTGGGAAGGNGGSGLVIIEEIV